MDNANSRVASRLKREKKNINYDDEPYCHVLLLVQEKHDNANFKKNRNGLKVVKAGLCLQTI